MSLLHAHDRVAHDLLPQATAEGGGGDGVLVARIDPRARIVAAALFALVVVALGRLPAAGAALGMAVLAATAARLAVADTLQKLLALDGFMVLALASLPFTAPGETAFVLGGFAASWAGLALALLILLKANAVLLMLLALIGMLEAVALGQALRRLGLPEKLVQLYLFTIRYLDLLGREYRRLRLAMRARAFRMRTDRHTWRMIGYLFGMLMVRSVERSERIVGAMRCRGFDGRFRCLAEPAALRGRDGAFALAMMAALIVLVAVEAA